MKTQTKKPQTLTPQKEMKAVRTQSNGKNSHDFYVIVSMTRGHSWDWGGGGGGGGCQGVYGRVALPFLLGISGGHCRNPLLLKHHHPSPRSDGSSSSSKTSELGSNCKNDHEL